MIALTTRQAIRQARAAADAIIEQRTRQAAGWDKGLYRDDDVYRMHTIEHRVRLHVRDAWDAAALAV